MSRVAPPIYLADHASPPMAWATRAVALGVALACLAVLGTAAWLRPDPSYYGTHRQLGMAPCGLLTMTGVPCPTCGMTTSFTNLVHGHVLRSLIGQPAGTVLCLLTAMAAWGGLYVAVTGRPGGAIVRRLPVNRAIVVLTAIVLLGWVYSIAHVLLLGAK